MLIPFHPDFYRIWFVGLLGIFIASFGLLFFLSGNNFYQEYRYHEARGILTGVDSIVETIRGTNHEKLIAYQITVQQDDAKSLKLDIDPRDIDLFRLQELSRKEVYVGYDDAKRVYALKTKEREYLTVQDYLKKYAKTNGILRQAGVLFMLIGICLFSVEIVLGIKRAKARKDKQIID